MHPLDPTAAARDHLFLHGFTVIDPSRMRRQQPESTAIGSATNRQDTLAEALVKILRECPNILPEEGLPTGLREKILTPVFQRVDASGTVTDGRGDQRLQVYFNEIKKALADVEITLPSHVRMLVSFDLNI